MTDKKTSNLLLANGEHYIEPIKKIISGRAPEFPREYEEARQLIKSSIVDLEQRIKSYPANKMIKDSIIFSLRLNEKFIAKTYFPEKLIKAGDVEVVGSRKWTNRKKKDDSKIIFLRGDTDSLELLSKNLDVKESKLTKSFMNDIRKLESISFLDEAEQLLGFEDFDEGRVEIVLHPLGKYAGEGLSLLMKQFRQAGVKKKDVRIAQYDKGLSFVSAKINKDQLDCLKGFNPLRTAHPLSSIKIPNLRDVKANDAPKPNSNTVKSSVKVGVFDGGADDTIPLLSNHVKSHDTIKSKSNASGIGHGSAVAGAVLYGALNEYGSAATVPQPNVFVESFRVLPTSDPNDNELYEVIDCIESTVHSRPDIKVFNVSLGPCGPIYDDDITRFTYSLDKLSFDHNVLFTIACGNDGNSPSPLDRIQAPADMINGLGIGAYSYNIKGTKAEKARAPYSCVGPGREGGKIKPDLVSYGGCSSHPIHLVSSTHNGRLLSAGTSFSSPIVAGLAAELMGRCDRLGPLASRTLLIHSSSHPNGSPCVELGHGFVPDRVEDIIHCDNNSYSVLYQSSLRTSSYAKLPIPYLDPAKVKGNVTIKWTICVLTNPDNSNPDEYSNVSIQDTFYPHSKKFRFTSLDGKKTKTLDMNSADKKALASLKGWKQSKWPVSKSGNEFMLPEKEQKAELKWDTVATRISPMRGASLHEPYITLHALGRNELEESLDMVQYAVLVTVEAPKFQGDLYSEISKIYNKLEPLEIKAANQVLVST